ncbi:hypothetical protein F2Q70_00035244 [Brassica cretica]|uniref:Uncharacterized protein n=1 Tax=Brassica cretica TaxID=69181 RepID=A0A8S9JV36_BRACR|nr:hypothetical protein F2Q70_00035244 [Brassica cretica]
MSSPVNLLLDLGTILTWHNCRKIRLLSSLHVVSCKSSTCKSIPGNGCDVKNTAVATGRVVQDNATIFTTQIGKPISISPSRHFTFS